MSGFHVENSFEFISALVHGWWARGANDGRLEDLARCGTVDNFLHQLQSWEILGSFDHEAVLHAFLLRQYRRLDRLSRLTGDAMHQYMESIKDELRNENIKLILNYRFFPERVGQAEDVLIPFPGTPNSRSQIYAMLEAPTTGQFARQLCRRHEDLPQLQQIIEQLERDHDIMRAENAIDNIGIAKTMDAAARIRGAAGESTRAIMCMMTDCTNAITLLRNASFYHLGHDAMEAAWLSGGQLINHRLWQTLSERATREEVLAALPEPLPSIMAASPGDSLAQLENRLNRHLLRQARRYFCDAGSPALAVAVYPVILQFETINLSRLYEGIRFSLPVETILEMLVA